MESQVSTFDVPLIYALFAKQKTLQDWANAYGYEIEFADYPVDIVEFGSEDNGQKAFQGFVLPSVMPSIDVEKN